MQCRFHQWHKIGNQREPTNHSAFSLLVPLKCIVLLYRFLRKAWCYVPCIHSLFAQCLLLSFLLEEYFRVFEQTCIRMDLTKECSGSSMEAVVSSGIKRSLTQSPNDSGRLLSILFTTEHSTLCVVLFVVFCFKMKNRRIEAYWTEISKNLIHGSSLLRIVLFLFSG